MSKRASFTAAMIAVSRSLGRVLPEDARLIDDPFGARFATPLLRVIARSAHWLRPLIEGTLVTVQVRTRLLDEALVGFVEQGGAQVLLLGAGFDARAARFAPALAHARVFEVDQPATQAKKRALMPELPSLRYLPWDFETQAVAELPRALAALGHDPSQPTLTLWEGVTMYLSAEAVDATARAVRALSAPGSRFVLTYLERAAQMRPSAAHRVVARLVRRWGEPLRFGFDPAALPAWMAERGFALEHDLSFKDAAAVMVPARYAALLEPSARVAFVAPSA
ncbi:MAG: class I SAM-dependent methyltransferase [Deltaproteobacteria bacterium]|nr:class I SAM-dependent methyltransferase [Deltaproteobacteria bacterium]